MPSSAPWQYALLVPGDKGKDGFVPLDESLRVYFENGNGGRGTSYQIHSNDLRWWLEMAWGVADVSITGTITFNPFNAVGAFHANPDTVITAGSQMVWNIDLPSPSDALARIDQRCLMSPQPVTSEWSYPSVADSGEMHVGSFTYSQADYEDDEDPEGSAFTASMTIDIIAQARIVTVLRPVNLTLTNTGIGHDEQIWMIEASTVVFTRSKFSVAENTFKHTYNSFPDEPSKRFPDWPGEHSSGGAGGWLFGSGSTNFSGEIDGSGQLVEEESQGSFVVEFVNDLYPGLPQGGSMEGRIFSDNEGTPFYDALSIDITYTVTARNTDPTPL